MPEKLYHSPRGLYDFQAEHVAYCLLRQRNLLAWDTGLGKTHGAMATGAMLYEDDSIDIMVLVAERGKVTEWRDDFAEFTSLTTAMYMGGKATRQRKLAPERLPQVLIVTYETAREDMVVKDKADPRKFTPGVLTEALAGKRVLLVYDEMSKLGNRTSLLHRAHAYAIKTWSDAKECRVLGLTATPMERNPESYYNLGRILTPGTIGTVKSFHAEHVLEYDMFGNPSKFKHLPALAQKMAPVLLRKRKTDPDVRDQFPQMVEKFTFVPLGDAHQRFYDDVERFVHLNDDPITEQVGFNLLRMIAGHPLSIMDSHGEMGSTLAAQIGEEALRRMGSAKTDHLVEYVSAIQAQGAQAVVFTYFVSVLKLLEKALLAAKPAITVVTNHGQMSPSARDAAKATFRAGGATVFLTSAAGEKGINLPEASYVVNYDLPTKHTSYLQRINRISRIGSVNSEIVVAKSFIAADTIEEGISGLWLGRNYANDVLLDWDHDEAEDDAFLTSSDRRALLRVARKQQKE